MTSPATTHYLNSDFDLSLRPRPRQLEHRRIARQVHELSVQALIGAAERDAALVRLDVPPDFLDYLAESGLDVPRLLRHPTIDPAARLRPFGWSAEASELNRLHSRPERHPCLTTLRKVNSRSFSRELEADHEVGGPCGVVVESTDELQSFLSRAPSATEWVIKAEHGHAALANRRVRGCGLTETDRRFVEDRFAEDDRLVVEPWFQREQDWCVVFEVPFDASSLRVHETVCTRDGALIGALFDPTGKSSAPWRDELSEMAERVASRLSDQGYFGPACVDAFCWSDGARISLRPLVDLNCRLSISDGAHRLWQRTVQGRTLYYRFFNRRKLSLPPDLLPALVALGQLRYDPAARRGVLLASPPWVGGGEERWRPGKLALIFVAPDREGIRELEDRFRVRFEV